LTLVVYAYAGTVIFDHSRDDAYREHESFMRSLSPEDFENLNWHDTMEKKFLDSLNNASDLVDPNDYS